MSLLLTKPTHICCPYWWCARPYPPSLRAAGPSSWSRTSSGRSVCRMHRCKFTSLIHSHSHSFLSSLTSTCCWFAVQWEDSALRWADCWSRSWDSSACLDWSPLHSNRRVDGLVSNWTLSSSEQLLKTLLSRKINWPKFVCQHMCSLFQYKWSVLQDDWSTLTRRRSHF